MKLLMVACFIAFAVLMHLRFDKNNTDLKLLGCILPFGLFLTLLAVTHAYNVFKGYELRLAYLKGTESKCRRGLVAVQTTSTLFYFFFLLKFASMLDELDVDATEEASEKQNEML